MAMVKNQADKAPRRIAVILGSGGSGRSLLDLVPPLLSRERQVEMQAMFKPRCSTPPNCRSSRNFAG